MLLLLLLAVIVTVRALLNSSEMMSTERPARERVSPSMKSLQIEVQRSEELVQEGAFDPSSEDDDRVLCALSSSLIFCLYYAKGRLSTR